MGWHGRSIWDKKSVCNGMGRTYGMGNVLWPSLENMCHGLPLATTVSSFAATHAFSNMTTEFHPIMSSHLLMAGWSIVLLKSSLTYVCHFFCPGFCVAHGSHLYFLLSFLSHSFHKNSPRLQCNTFLRYFQCPEN